MLHLQVGLRFKQSWKGALNPKQYKIIAVNEEENSITVESKRIGEPITRYNPVKVEVWPDADRLHIYFELGDFRVI